MLDQFRFTSQKSLVFNPLDRMSRIHPTETFRLLTGVLSM
jgi:hypothetical protein